MLFDIQTSNDKTKGALRVLQINQILTKKPTIIRPRNVADCTNVPSGLTVRKESRNKSSFTKIRRLFRFRYSNPRQVDLKGKKRLESPMRCPKLWIVVITKRVWRIFSQDCLHPFPSLHSITTMLGNRSFDKYLVQYTYQHFQIRVKYIWETLRGLIESGTYEVCSKNTRTVWIARLELVSGESAWWR